MLYSFVLQKKLKNKKTKPKIKIFFLVIEKQEFDLFNLFAVESWNKYSYYTHNNYNQTINPNSIERRKHTKQRDQNSTNPTHTGASIYRPPENLRHDSIQYTTIPISIDAYRALTVDSFSRKDYRIRTQRFSETVDRLPAGRVFRCGILGQRRWSGFSVWWFRRDALWYYYYYYLG